MLMSRLRQCHTIISRRNWTESKPLLISAIREADFVSFDYELTGLHEKNERFLGVDMAYDAHAEGVKRFLPVQLGICASRFDSGTGTWELTPASIYLYPTDEVCFSVSTAALNFLVLNGFDCNEWIRHGMSWLTPIQEEEQRRGVQSRIDEINEMVAKSVNADSRVVTPSFTPLDIPPGPDKEAMTAVHAAITAWLPDGSAPLELPMESAFTRLLAHTYISHEFPSLFSHSVKRADARLLCVYRNRSDLFVEQLETLGERMKEIDDQVGVRVIFDEISRMKKPLVGHNCFYDLLHTWHTFYGQIPAAVDPFKSKWMSKFKQTFDTKFIADETLGQLAPGTLGALCEEMIKSSPSGVKMCVKPLSHLKQQYHLPNSETKNDLSHDAGYDAMMTSIVYIHQLEHIKERKLDDANSSTDFNTQIAHLMKSNCNRIRLVKTQPPSLNLAERN